MTGHAQTVTDTLKPLHISTDLKKMIRFSGYMQPPRVRLIISDSIKFNGVQTVREPAISDFMRMSQAEEDKYRKQMEAVYKPLREEQQRIIESGAGKGTFRYGATLGYPNPFTRPTELLNPNTHQEDKSQAWKAKEAEIMKKYEQPDK